jgi:hypothetical protein
VPDDVLDTAIGEPPLSPSAHPERAVREPARVARPYGPVVLTQPPWTSEISPEPRELVAGRAGPGAERGAPGPALLTWRHETHITERAASAGVA